MTMKFTKLAACSVLILSSAAAMAADMEKKGVTPYVTHFIFRPVQNLDISGLGTATLLEAVDGACVLADADGDKIFSTFDTRDLDKSQPDMNCGTHHHRRHRQV
jgi:hypothetical protein